MKKGRRLLLGLAILLLGLQMSCATAEQNGASDYRAKEIHTVETSSGTLPQADAVLPAESADGPDAALPAESEDGPDAALPAESAGGPDAALLMESADRTEGALPVPPESEEVSLTGAADVELLGSPVKETGISEDGTYTGKEEVSLYLHLYNHLPDNYITKKEAKKLGWDSSKGNLWDVAPGKSIGGDYFGNYEGLLPEDEDRDYFECDIDYEGGRRNARRIIYSDDGLIFYTEDHYKTFEQLYGDE